MTFLAAQALKLLAGETVTCHPKGNSMRPLIRSGQEVIIAPTHGDRVEKDDIVLVKVSGRIYLHKVIATDHQNRRVLIGNNRGRLNGWTSFDRVFGICTKIQGVDRPNLEGKVLP